MRPSAFTRFFVAADNRVDSFLPFCIRASLSVMKCGSLEFHQIRQPWPITAVMNQNHAGGKDVTALQISNNVKQVVHGTRQVTSGISDVNKEASNTGSASEGVLASARALSEESNKLRLEADKFLATVRAA